MLSRGGYRGGARPPLFLDQTDGLKSRKKIFGVWMTAPHYLMGPLYHLTPGTQVTQVSATDDESDDILYEIGADGTGKFNINNATGWIISKVVIDREVCIAVCVSKLSYRLSRIHQNFNGGNRIQLSDET